MRAVLVALALTVAMPAWAAKMPDQACSVQFVKKWRNDKVAMVETPGAMPEKPCLMSTETGPYICNKNGCVRANAYLEDNN